MCQVPLFGRTGVPVQQTVRQSEGQDQPQPQAEYYIGGLGVIAAVPIEQDPSVPARAVPRMDRPVQGCAKTNVIRGG